MSLDEHKSTWGGEMEEVLIVDTGKCTGCSVCELVCSMAKHGEYNPRRSYIRVMRNREMDVNVVALSVRCDFCGHCVQWCSTNALCFVSFEEAAIIRKENKPGIIPTPLLGGI